jgi:hypothetical protein
MKVIPTPNDSSIEIVKYTEFDPILSGLEYSTANNYIFYKDYKFSIKRKNMKFSYVTGTSEVPLVSFSDSPKDNWYYYMTYAVIRINRDGLTP